MNKKKIIKILLLLLFLTLMIFSAKNIIEWKNENKKVKNIVEKAEEKLIKEEGTAHLDEDIKNDNPYTIGWLIVEGTNINYPVVKYTDNQYYLKHDFNNNKNSAGWIFMDYQNSLTDQNIVIYGHHRRDGSMFGSIDDLFKNNKELNITLITFEGIINYKIFSIYKASSHDNYNNRYFEDFNKTIKEFESKSSIDFNQDLEEANQIITLSTCDDNNIDRIVVHGYKN